MEEEERLDHPELSFARNVRFRSEGQTHAEGELATWFLDKTMSTEQVTCVEDEK